MPSNAEAREFAEATEHYARLAKELVACRKTRPHATYENKLLEMDAARERCDRARHALKALRIKRRQQNPK